LKLRLTQYFNVNQILKRRIREYENDISAEEAAA
jgi:hypothetical protein